jgi:hypothetical protein
MIEARGLRKVHRTKKRRPVTMVDAVRDVDLTVAEGEIYSATSAMRALFASHLARTWSGRARSSWRR